MTYFRSYDTEKKKRIIWAPQNLDTCIWGADFFICMKWFFIVGDTEYKQICNENRKICNENYFLTHFPWYLQFSSVQSISCVWLFVTPWITACQASLPVLHKIPEFTHTLAHRVGDALEPISSSVIPFSSCTQSFPASGSFQMSQLFAWGGQSNEVSASASVLPMNTQD